MTRSATPATPPDASDASGASDASAFWSRPADELLAALGSTDQGLSDAEAARRLRRDGPNALDEEPTAGAARLLLRQFQSPLVLILVFGGAVSAALGDWLDAAIILAVVLGSSGLGFLQEYRAANAVAQLRGRLALTARVLRDGAQRLLPTRELVSGDIVDLSAGHLVPADGLVLQARDFLVSEASLTGESFPVEKQPGVLDAGTPLARRTNAVYLGTSVRSGTARVLVVHTGERTAFGAVAQRLRSKPPATEFARGVQQFGILLLRVMVVMVLFVLIVNQWQGRPWVESMLFAVALAVGLSPELLPAIVSVTLSAGARRMAGRGVIVRQLEAIENLGSMDLLCTDKTGTLTEGTMRLEAATDPDGTASAEVLRLAYLNAAFETGIDNPLDAALVAAGTEAGLDTHGLRKVDEIPYDFIRKRLSIVVVPEAGGAHQIITKGAFDNLLAICTDRARGADTVPLDDVERDRLARWYQAQGESGRRLLALATRRVEPRKAYGREDEAGLCLMGFLLFVDPPKASARQTLQRLAALGITVKVITGDNRHVAAHVAASVGLDAGALLTGEQIDAMKDEALWPRAAATTLFVEVDPQHKERIVRALQHRGRCVGYLGDGINDAPALHAADVGISVDGAVDVARDSADVVLLRHDLDVLCQGVEEGRRSFANTLKYVGITTSANFGNMVSMALAAPLLPFLPLAAKQILLNNFLSDLPSLAISSDEVDADRLTTAQHWDVHDLRRYMLVFGLVSSVFDLLTFALLLKVFRAPEAQFQTAWFVVSVLTELAVLLVLRTHRPAWGSRPGTLLWTSTVAVALVAVALPFVPPVAAIFGLVALPPTLLAAMGGVVLAYAGATEFAKFLYFRRLPARGAGIGPGRRCGHAGHDPIPGMTNSNDAASGAAPGAAAEGIRLSKVMAERGLASRREADEWIEAGWVRVDGAPAVLGQRVAIDAAIDIDPLAKTQQAQRVTVLLHKPMGFVSGQAEDGYQPAVVLVTAANRWAEDKTPLKFHHGHLRHLAPAGRLDIDSTGLLVLTQDGRIAKQLIGEDSRVEKEYLVRVQSRRPDERHLPFPAENMRLLQHGLELDGRRLRPARVSWANEDQLRFVLREGRKRQIRRMCELVGLEVLGLKRVRIGSVVLGKLPPGQWRYLRQDERF